jgi:hypothetical protein
MQNNIRHLLDELYDIEPLLQSKENEIVHIIDTMLKNRPEAPIDERLKRKLRTEIMATFVEEKKKEKRKISYKDWFFPITAVTFAALFFSTIPFSFFGKDIFNWNNSSSLGKFSFSQSVEKVSDGAFSLWSWVNKDMPSWVQNEMGWDTGWKMAKMMTVGSDSMITPSESVRYNYIYTGTLDLPQWNLSVYEKNIVPIDSKELNSFISWFSFDGFDIHALKNTKMTSLTLVEERNFGYIVSADFVWWTLSLYPNYEKWPQQRCDMNWCKMPGKSDLPSDSELLSLGESFLKKYWIDIHNYWTGRIDTTWKNWVSLSSDWSNDESVPESLTIMYPLLLGDKTVYEEGGSPRGITLGYDVRNKQISSLYGLWKESLRESEYRVTTDIKTLKSFILQWWLYPILTDRSSQEKIIDIILDVPELIYMHVSRTDNDWKLKEYYVPSLLFRVINKPIEVYVWDTITIPIIDEFMKIENPWLVTPYTSHDSMVR